MGEKINQFCESLRQQLTEVETKLNHVKGDLETAPQEAQNLVQSKLEDAKAQVATNKRKAEDAKANVQQWLEAKKSEITSQVDGWKAQREAEKLSSRADRTEEYAISAIVFAAAAVQEAQVAVLEAVEARLAADEAVLDD
jgi:glutamine synthetase adenylyltransferase